jgi:outer membrane lipoprotein-sorting protein
LRQEQIDGRPTDVVQLIPAVPNLPFSQAVIWLDQGSALPRRLEIHEESGATRTLSLKRIRVNESLPDRIFTFQVPKGVRVVDQ